MASAAGQPGRMWGHAYSVANSGIYVAPESALRQPTDLANVEVGVGYHSGSHFSALQALESFLPTDQIRFRYIGLPNDRLAALLGRKIPAANIFGAPAYVVEQQGFRKLVDTTFMIGFLFGPEADVADVERYFRALQRAQRDIDLQPERYKHYFLRALPERYQAMVDVRTFGPGERLVFEPYTREAFERTHRWMETRQRLLETEISPANYDAAVLV
jgi:NitT/TauT family transport system substrate-binding protein